MNYNANETKCKKLGLYSEWTWLNWKIPFQSTHTCIETCRIKIDHFNLVHWFHFFNTKRYSPFIYNIVYDNNMNTIWIHYWHPTQSRNISTRWNKRKRAKNTKSKRKRGGEEERKTAREKNEHLNVFCKEFFFYIKSFYLWNIFFYQTQSNKNILYHKTWALTELCTLPSSLYRTRIYPCYIKFNVK